MDSAPGQGQLPLGDAGTEHRRRLQTILAAVPVDRCRCDLRPTMTDRELIALGAGCTHPSYVCPRLDAVRRRLTR